MTAARSDLMALDPLEMLLDAARFADSIKPEWAKAARKAVAAARLAASQPDREARAGIYIASKTKHADRWRFLRDKVGEPIISTWIDEAGEGESSDLHDLWHRCLTEAASCRVLIAYREKNEVLKGGWVEIGAALSAGIPVYAVGLEEFTIAKYRGITHFPDMKAAIAASRILLSGAGTPAPAVGADVGRRVLDILNAVAPAVENLVGHQEQCDMDGVMVKVSRQALDEVLNAVNEVALVSALTRPLGGTQNEADNDCSNY